ncbi:hypothetical protein F2Q70_00004857 [Brassica cretica]|uniref:Uncharacterized protein n=1 Tax=Brassica cretica TaxID=69181 RepID=A0A8S9IVY5_BRACR|nr:hypothetical protein F2Q70_00004857 [Brassica cretica]
MQDRRRSKSHVPAGNKTRKKSRPTRSKLSSKTITHRAMPSEAEEGEVSGEACEDPIAPASLKEVLPGDSSPVSKSADHPALGKEGCSHNLAEDHDVVHGEPHIETHPEKEQFLMGFGDNQHSKKDAEDPFFLVNRRKSGRMAKSSQ